MKIQLIILSVFLLAAGAEPDFSRAQGQNELRPQAAPLRAQLGRGSLSGVVIGPDSRALAGAAITASLRDGNTAVTTRSFSAVTDGNGGFNFGALPAGAYEVQVESPETWLMTKTTQQVVVSEREATAVEIRLEFIAECRGDEPQSLSDADRTEIVRLMLEEALVGKKIPSYVTLTSAGKNVPAATANIEAGWLPAIPGYHLTLLTSAEIRRRADGHGDFMYLEFDPIKASGSCVGISLSNFWAISAASIEAGRTTLLGEGRLNYIFRKERGKWVGKFISGWIS